MSTPQWTAYRNTLSAADVSRIRKTMKALEQGSMSGSATHSPQGHSKEDNAGSLAGGRYTRGTRQPPSPPCRSTTYRSFYRVDSAGRKSGHTKYHISGSGLKELAEELVEAALHRATQGAPPLVAIPASVREAVDDAVHHRILTPQQGDAFVKKYQRYGRATDHATVYLREQGKRTIREYEGCYRMLKHPSHTDLVNGRVRRLAVEYVGAVRQ